MAMRDDPIVAELRAIRDRLAAECDYDIEEIFRRVRKRQAESGLEHVSPAPRRAAPRQDAAGPPSDEGAQRDDDGA